MAIAQQYVVMELLFFPMSNAMMLIKLMERDALQLVLSRNIHIARINRVSAILINKYLLIFSKSTFQLSHATL
jgi:hypothetical protein